MPKLKCPKCGWFPKNKEFNELIEKLANIEHVQWMTWSEATATSTLSREELTSKWKLYWMAYEELPEETKEKDRIWARIIFENVLDTFSCSCKPKS